MKKHLSQIVIRRTLTIIIGTFCALMAVTFLLVYIYTERKAEDYVRSSLEDLNNIVIHKMDHIQKRNLINDVRYLDDIYTQEGADYIKSREFADEFIEDTGWLTEKDLVDPDGIIVISSEADNEGFNMRSVPESEGFLNVLEGSDKVYHQEMSLQPGNASPYIYYGMYVPGYGGFVMLGLDRKTYDAWHQNAILSQIICKRVGETGYYLYLSDEAEILGIHWGLQCEDSFISPGELEELAKSRDVIKKDVNGVRSYIGVFPGVDGYIVSVYPVSEAWMSWNILILVLLIIYIAVFTILFFLINHLLVKNVVLGVYSINDSLGLISQGNLDEKADFRSSLEFDHLSEGINLTVDRLKDLIREAEGRIDAELALASRIQASYLPREFSPFPERTEFELYASMVPARDVGGDFYDYFLLDDDHLVLVIADVSGKGIPAALFMAAAINKLRGSVSRHGTDLVEAVTEVNLELFEENEEFLFVTAWIGILTVSTGHVDYVDAGHDHPAICRKGEGFRIEEDVHSLPLAARKKTKYKAGAFELGAGDILYLYTDGVTEANNTDGEMFRTSRMLASLNDNAEASAEDIDTAVRAAIKKFAGDAPQFDDTTMLVLIYRGSRQTDRPEPCEQEQNGTPAQVKPGKGRAK